MMLKVQVASSLALVPVALAQVYKAMPLFARSTSKKYFVVKSTLVFTFVALFKGNK